MKTSELDAILDGAVVASGDLASSAQPLLAACIALCGCERGQFWLWSSHGSPPVRQLEPIAVIGEDWEGNLLSTAVELPERDGEVRTTRSAGGLFVAYLRFGAGGFIALAGPRPVDAGALAELTQSSSRIERWVSTAALHEDLLRGHRMLLSQSALDRSAATSLASVRSVADLGRMIEQFSEQLFPIEYSGIYFLDPTSGQLRLVFAKGLSEEEQRNAERTAPQRHPGQVLRTGLPVEVDDTTVGGDPSEPPGHGRLVRSRMYLPVRVEGKTVGAIGFASSRPGSFGKRHHDALAFLCDLAGVTYARLRDHEQLLRRGKLLEATATANERLLKSLDWREVATAALALVGDALEVPTLALIRLERSADADQLDFIWQPFFGAPWPHRDRVARLQEAEVALLRGGLALELQAGQDQVTLKPVLVADDLWGVLACEAKPGEIDRLAKTERAALRGLASGFASAIERERIDRELRERQQVDAVSRLAGGIAHDFNNLLWPILLYSDMLERETALDGRSRQMLQDIRRSATRASELVQQVFAVARSRDRMIEVVDVPELAVDVSATARHGAPPEVRLLCNIDTDAGHVLGDRDALRELLRSLLALALEDLGQPAGEIRFTVERVERDRGSWMRVAIDRGRRILSRSAARDAALRRLVTEVTGEFVSGSSASLDELEVFLPISLREQSPSEGDAEPVPASESTPPAEIAAAGALRVDRVLLVDDDAAVLEVARQIIESLGYEVVGCHRPENALEVLKDESSALSLLLTDLAMPGMDGLTLAREAKRLRPGLPVICCTGFGDARAERTAKEIGVTAFLRKPIDFDHYARTIRSAIEAARPAHS